MRLIALAIILSSCAPKPVYRVSATGKDSRFNLFCKRASQKDCIKKAREFCKSRKREVIIESKKSATGLYGDQYSKTKHHNQLCKSTNQAYGNPCGKTFPNVKEEAKYLVFRCY